jgi:hypothetical protein
MIGRRIARAAVCLQMKSLRLPSKSCLQADLKSPDVVGLYLIGIAVYTEISGVRWAAHPDNSRIHSFIREIINFLFYPNRLIYGACLKAV